MPTLSRRNSKILRENRVPFAQPPGEDFGIASWKCGRGLQADVLYSGLPMAKDSAVNPAEIMGHVMAHELGHLLLGMKPPSGLGSCKPTGRGQQLRQMSIGVSNSKKNKTPSKRLGLGNQHLCRPRDRGTIRESILRSFFWPQQHSLPDPSFQCVAESAGRFIQNFINSPLGQRI